MLVGAAVDVVVGVTCAAVDEHAPASAVNATAAATRCGGILMRQTSLGAHVVSPKLGSPFSGWGRREGLDRPLAAMVVTDEHTKCRILDRRVQLTMSVQGHCFGLPTFEHETPVGPMVKAVQTRFEVDDAGQVRVSGSELLPRFVVEQRVYSVVEFPLQIRGRSESKTCCLQTSHQLSAVALESTALYGDASGLDVDVVVIALKAHTATAECTGKFVQLVEVVVGDQVAPGGPTPRPSGLIDQNCHWLTVERTSALSTRSFCQRKRRPPQNGGVVGEYHRHLRGRLAHSKM